uniref:Uncharacterized protein n=1 Tax=Arcella intermedia TaxID=1963864 RepID=A0A6B2LR60_9EUKA
MVNQVISQFLNTSRSLTRLDLIIVNSNQHRLSSLHTHHPRGTLLSIDRPLISLQHQILLPLDEQTTRSQRSSISKSLDQSSSLVSSHVESGSDGPSGAVVSEDGGLSDVSSSD